VAIALFVIGLVHFAQALVLQRRYTLGPRDVAVARTFEEVA